MILEIEKLDIACLNLLTSQKILAIRVKQFINNDLAKKLTNKILTSGYDNYINAPSIGRIGMAFYEAGNRPDLIEAYFRQAQDNIDNLRNRCLPYISPIDLLRCTLDELWPAGAHLEILYGKKMFVGLSRIVEPNVYFLAHHDILAKDAMDSYKAYSLLGQFACNVYLNVPEKGGELEIWEKEITPEDFDRIRGDSYGIDPAILGDPSVQIKPKSGEIIIFNSRKIHAVAPSFDAPRLSLSCFIGYRGSHAPLTFWS